MRFLIFRGGNAREIFRGHHLRSGVPYDWLVSLQVSIGGSSDPKWGRIKYSDRIIIGLFIFHGFSTMIQGICGSNV